MDPFSDDAEEEADARADNWSTVSVQPIKRRRRPWWRWNPLTLAGTLFLILWVRELGGLPLSMTGLLVATIFVAWAVTPLALLGTPLLTLAPAPPPTRRSSDRRRAWQAGTACRIAAILFASLGLVQACLQVSWVVAQGFGAGQSAAVWWTFFTKVAWDVSQSLAIAIGLWTIGGIAASVQRLTQAEADGKSQR